MLILSSDNLKIQIRELQVGFLKKDDFSLSTGVELESLTKRLLDYDQK